MSAGTTRDLLADAERRAERFALIVRVGGLITADLRLDDMLQRAADAIHEMLGYENVAIPLYDSQHETLLLSVFGGSYKRLMRGSYRIPIAHGIMGSAVRERRAVLVNDVQNDPRWLPTPGSTGIHGELAVPILLADRVLGVLNVESVHGFTDDDVETLQVVAEQLAVAIENARLFAAAAQAAALVERGRIARDLHDAVTQALFSMTLIAGSLSSAWRRDPAEGERRVERLLELAATAHGELRALLRELMPPPGSESSSGEPAQHESSRHETSRSLPEVLRMRGLVAVLSVLLEQWRSASPDVEVSLDVARYVPQSEPVEEAILRVAGEAVANALRHASPAHVGVKVEALRENVVLEVRDDGAGTAPAALQEGRGFGLRTMRERAESLGGAFHIAASTDGGTVVNVSIPCVEPDAEPAARPRASAHEHG